MKNTIIKFSSLALIILISSAFITDFEEKKTEVKTSTIVWKAYKVTGSHEGTIALKEGYLLFEENQLSGGRFTVNMASIHVTDLNGEYQEKLISHLKSDDFFGVKTHPEAVLEFKEVEKSGKNAYTVLADLTIKGHSHPANFVLSVYNNRANATLKVDRSQYDVRYGSGSFFENLGDKTIYDEFDLVVDLEF